MRFKKRKCNKCHKEFKTEVDERGFSIETRCWQCKKKEGNIVARKLNKVLISKTRGGKK